MSILSDVNAYDPDISWKTVSSDHFLVHYPEGDEKLANAVLASCEKAHAALSGPIGWSPFFRTDVILADFSDEANAAAGPVPWNTLIIRPVRPDSQEFITGYRNYLDYLAYHEYTHILHMDMVNGLPGFTRVFPGRFFFPGAMQPVWNTEGFAVYQESEHEFPGRNHSVMADMVVRMAADSGDFPGLSDLGNYKRAWPAGNLPYIFGGRFIEYMNKRYGKDTFAATVKANSDNLVPALTNYNAREVYKRGFSDIYDEFRKETEAEQKRILSAIRSAGETKLQFAENSRYLDRLPRVYGKDLVFIRDHGEDDPLLVRMESTGEGFRETEAMADWVSPGDVLVNGKDLLVLEMAIGDSYREFREVYHWSDGDLRKEEGKSRCQSITGDPESGYFCSAFDGMNQQIRHYPPRGGVNILASSSSAVFQNVRLSPEKKTLAFSRSENGETDIVLYFLTEQKIRVLHLPGTREITPNWQDEKRLLFTGDTNGVPNIRRLDLEKNEIETLSNVTGGLFDPQIHPDGLILVRAYTAEGFRIGWFRPEKGPMAPADLQDTPDFAAETGAAPAQVSGESYQPWRSLMPFLWYPLVYSSQPLPSLREFTRGLGMQGTDALGRHLWGLQLREHTVQNSLEADVFYEYGGLRFSPFVRIHSANIVLGTDPFPYDYAATMGDITRTTEDKLETGFVRHWRTARTRSAFGWNLFGRNLREDSVKNLSSLRSWKNRAGTGLFGAFDSTGFFRNSISPEKGILIAANGYAEKNRGDIGGEFPGHTTSGGETDLSLYLPGFYRAMVFLLQARAKILVSAENELFPLAGEGIPGTGSFGQRALGRFSPEGTRAILGTAEIRLPLWQIDRGFSDGPLFFRDLWITPWADAGIITESDWQRRVNLTFGAEIHLSNTVLYFLQWNSLIGYGYAPHSAEHTVYFSLFGIFGGDILHSPVKSGRPI